MNVVSERLFKIGRLWLDFPEVASMKEIRQVNFEHPTEPLPSEEPPKVPKAEVIFKPNFTDKQKPLFDTAGNGVASLTAVWMNDPTGPLADDAMMLVASYYLRRGNWVEADRYFQMLRETFPNSPHVENAFVLGAHSKLMSYHGPDYEGRTLREAQLLKESTIKLYPNNPEVDRIKDELAKIEEAKALELWNVVELYDRKKKPRGVAVYCHRVIAEYPKSAYATQARAKLVELGPEYTNGAKFLTPNEEPKNDLVTRIFETPTYRLKKYPMIGAAREDKQPGQDQSKRMSKAAEKSKVGEYEDSSEEVEQAPNVDPEKPAKKRRSWNPFGAPPEKLPVDAADGAKKLNSSTLGQSRL
jgi:tetratricopeptide (TPR) repeat protein